MAKPNRNRPSANRSKKNTHKKKNPLISNVPPKKQVEEKLNDGVVVYEEGITVGELAEKVNQPAAAIIKFLFMLGKMLTINSSLDDETVELVCLEYGYETKKHVEVSEVNFEDIEIVDIKFGVSCSMFSEEQIYCFSAMLLYRKKLMMEKK